MKVVILYRPNSERARLTEEFIYDFQRRHPQQRLEPMNVDSRDGIALASIYDVMDYPSIMVLSDDGQVQKQWQGDSLPRIDEVAAYANL